jgi:hypothetical protein
MDYVDGALNERHAGEKDQAKLHLGTFDADFQALAQRIHAAVIAAEDMRDRVIRVNRVPESAQLRNESAAFVRTQGTSPIPNS